MSQVKPQQLGLGFSELEQDEWLEEWQDMPEFVQNKEAHCEITLKFQKKKDLENFNKLMGVQLTEKVKSIWFPFKTKGLLTNKRWVDGE